MTQQIPETPDEEPFATCKVCGCILEWMDCWNGCDDGYFDEYEDDPINADPGDLRPCPECRGEGGFLECPNAEHHAQILAERQAGQ
jgi:hypothetical protein